MSSTRANLSAPTKSLPPGPPKDSNESCSSFVLRTLLTTLPSLDVGFVLFSLDLVMPAPAQCQASPSVTLLPPNDRSAHVEYAPCERNDRCSSLPLMLRPFNYFHRLYTLCLDSRPHPLGCMRLSRCKYEVGQDIQVGNGSAAALGSLVTARDNGAYIPGMSEATGLKMSTVSAGGTHM